MSADLFFYNKPDNSASITLEVNRHNSLEITVLREDNIATIYFPHNEDNKKVIKDFASALLSWIDREI